DGRHRVPDSHAANPVRPSAYCPSPSTPPAKRDKRPFDPHRAAKTIAARGGRREKQCWRGAGRGTATSRAGAWRNRRRNGFGGETRVPDARAASVQSAEFDAIVRAGRTPAPIDPRDNVALPRDPWRLCCRETT